MSLPFGADCCEVRVRLMNRSRRAAITLFASIALAASWASADPPQGASDPCRGRHPGDACEADDFEGICKRRRCTRETDDGVRSFHCLVCESRRRHSGHRASSEPRHHRRHDALDAGQEDAPDAANDLGGDVVEESAADVQADVAVRRDGGARAAPATAARRGLFSCAAGPARSSSGLAWAVVAAAALARLRRRAAASAP